MKLKKLLCLFLTLSLIFCLIGCASTTAPKKDSTTKATETEAVSDPTEKPEETPVEKPDSSDSTTSSGVSPLLYKVTDTNGNTLWLFGSIHVGYDYFYPLPDYVYDAYESADAIAFEIDMRAFEKDTSAQMQALMPLLYTDGTTIKDHIDADTYNAAVKILSDHGLYNIMMDYYIPAFWFSTLESLFYQDAGLDSNLGIDYHLMDKAYEDGKEIQEVESAEFQYNMLADFSPELQEYLLESSLSYYDDPETAKEDVLKLVDLWKNGDEAAFAAYLATEDFESEEEKLLYAEYKKAMIVDRNLSMTDFAEDALASGEEVFICVGAAHIVGDGAMADLLAERGYTVELVK